MDRMNEITVELVELAGKRRRLVDEVQRIVESDAPTDGELQRADRQQTAIEHVDEQILELKAEQKDLVRTHARRNPGSVESTTPPKSPELMRHVDPYDGLEVVRARHIGGADMIGRAKAAVDQAPEWMDDTGREHVTRLLERSDRSHRDRSEIARHMLLTGSPEYHSAFEAFCAGRTAMWTEGEREAMRTAMSLADANGGFLVPFTLDPTIILTNAGIAGPIRSISRVEQTTTDTWNPVTSSGISAEWTAEATEWADATPTFAQPTITPKKADAWVFGSYEVLADSGFGQQLGRLLADAKVRLEEAAFATGNTGATVPRGVVAAVQAVTASLVAAAATNAFAVGDVYSTYDATTSRADENASWIGNKKIFTLIRRFDTAGSGSFWANLGAGVPNQLLGASVYECSTMAGAVATGAKVLMRGNFQDYVIVDRIGMQLVYDPVIRSTGNNRPTGQAGYAAYWRTGADVVNADSFRLLTLGAATAVALG